MDASVNKDCRPSLYVMLKINSSFRFLVIFDIFYGNKAIHLSQYG